MKFVRKWFLVILVLLPLSIFVLKLVGAFNLISGLSLTDSDISIDIDYAYLIDDFGEVEVHDIPI